VLNSSSLKPWRHVSPRRLRAAVATAAAVAGLLAPSQQRGAFATQTAAKSADALVDSIGVGLHVGYTRTPYWGQWEQTKSALLALGVRHFRDGLTDCIAAASRAFCRHYAELGQAGLTGDFVATLKTPMSIVSAFPSQVSGAFDSFEGPNEVDINGDPNWLADVSAFQQQLYATVKGNPATAKYAVIGPAIGHIQNYAKTSDLSAYFDYGNLHSYFGPVNPGTRVEGRIERWIGSARTFNSNKPDVTTETGYWDGPSGQGLPDAVIARYEPRLFLEQFAAGIVRTFQYEFIDEGGQDGIYAHAGLLANDLTPKPQYYALQSLIAVLKDPGPAFAPGSLDYDVSGNTDHLEHALFGKRDGSMYVALWLEKSSFDARTQSAVPVPAQQIQLTVNGPTAGATAIRFDDTGHTATRPLTFRGDSTEVPVDDHVVIVRVPARS
jgi:hypothetical protein